MDQQQQVPVTLEELLQAIGGKEVELLKARQQIGVLSAEDKRLSAEYQQLVDQFNRTNAELVSLKNPVVKVAPDGS